MLEEKRSKKKAAVKKRAAKRTLIGTGTDKRYVRRGVKSRFNESDDVGKSLAADRRKKAKAKAKRGQPETRAIDNGRSLEPNRD